MITIQQQTTGDKHWKDENGMMIPLARVTKLEQYKERQAHKLLKEATKASEALHALKELVRNVCSEVYERHMSESGIADDKRGKGNFMWYNFDRSIRIEVKIAERIEFDDLTIKAAKAKFDEFLDQNIEGKTDFAKELVLDAFETRNGSLDVKRVLSLLKYKSKVKDAIFQEAMLHLEASIRRPDSKTYFRIAVKDDNGEYQYVSLDFAAI